MKRFCVFCVSSPGQRQSSARSVKGLGKDPAHQNIVLILGGGKVSDMVINANTALENGGEVRSGITKSLVEKEVSITDQSDSHVVPSMNERKALMVDLSDVFIALLGGLRISEKNYSGL